MSHISHVPALHHSRSMSHEKSDFPFSSCLGPYTCIIIISKLGGGAGLPLQIYLHLLHLLLPAEFAVLCMCVCTSRVTIAFLNPILCGFLTETSSTGLRTLGVDSRKID